MIFLPRNACDIDKDMLCVTSFFRVVRSLMSSAMLARLRFFLNITLGFPADSLFTVVIYYELLFNFLSQTSAS